MTQDTFCLYSTLEQMNLAMRKGVFKTKGACEPGGGGGGVGGGAGRGRKRYPIYGIVRICMPNGPLFQRWQVYDYFQQKVYD